MNFFRTTDTTDTTDTTIVTNYDTTIWKPGFKEHKGSAVGSHLREQHDLEPDNIVQSSRILRKYQNKFDYPIFEMFFLKDLTPMPNNILIAPLQNYLFRSVYKSLLLFILLITLCPPMLILQIFSSPLYCIFYCFLVIMVLVNFLTVTNIFMLITCTFLTCT